MNLKIESDHLQDYLGEIPPVIRFNTPLIREQIIRIESQASTQTEKAKLAFETARDQISHSFDIQSMIITITAEDTLEKKKESALQNHICWQACFEEWGYRQGFVTSV